MLSVLAGLTPHPRQHPQGPGDAPVLLLRPPCPDRLMAFVAVATLAGWHQVVFHGQSTVQPWHDVIERVGIVAAIRAIVPPSLKD